MEQVVQEITWEAPDHIHQEKGNDWYMALGIITITGAGASLYLGNYLFSLLILISGLLIGFVATIEPKDVRYTLSKRGIRVDDKLYPFTELESFHIETEMNLHTTLLIKAGGVFGDLLIIPIPEEVVDDIEDILEDKLPEELLEEPFVHKLLEFFGF